MMDLQQRDHDMDYFTLVTSATVRSEVCTSLLPGEIFPKYHSCRNQVVMCLNCNQFRHTPGDLHKQDQV